MVVQGSPLEDDEKGALYFGNGITVTKVWKNKERGGRMWYKRIIGGGEKPAPQSKGQSVPAMEADIGVQQLGMMPDGRLIVFGRGSF
jgi:hypothetical protein